MPYCPANCKTRERRAAAPLSPIFERQCCAMEPPHHLSQLKNGLKVGLLLIHSAFAKALCRASLMMILCLWMQGLSVAAERHVPIGQFTQQSLAGWQEKEFLGKTQYRFVMDEQKQQYVLQAQSQGAASGLFFEQRIDLAKTPILHWSWKSSSSYRNIDENVKSGDDFVARIYIVIDGGVFFWQTLALNYVWSSSHQVGEKWANPFTSNATMFAVASGESQLGKWQHFQRNVRQDIRQLLGEEVRYIDAIAVMTDSDNSQQSATTHYADIYFSTALP